jgi:hypothetical protein
MTTKMSTTSTRHGTAFCRGSGELLPLLDFFLILEEAKIDRGLRRAIS